MRFDSETAPSHACSVLVPVMMRPPFHDRYVKFVPWFQCEYVWFPDDDMEMSVPDLRAFLRIAKAADLDVSTWTVEPEARGMPR